MIKNDKTIETGVLVNNITIIIIITIITIIIINNFRLKMMMHFAIGQ